MTDAEMIWRLQWREKQPGETQEDRLERLYVAPTDPVIQERMEWFQDQKFGFMMHWGPYSQLGIDASWGVCDEDWTMRYNAWQEDRLEFKKEYFGANKTFNPVRFNPEEWAAAMEECGFKYLTFTTKHHDGFCMFDSKYTDYKITAPDCPFSKHKYANICKELFEAGRRHGLGIGAYFSKADWSCPDYWEDRLADGFAYGRNQSYSIEEHPEKWEKFCEFTKNQIVELATDYGKVDIIWIDGGWVCPEEGQEIHMGDMIDEARKVQPGLICADRYARTEYENYVTPEQEIPARPVRVPWESCMTMGTSWGYKFSDTYKDARAVIRMLLEIVAKGGNLALNVGPQPDGRLPSDAMAILREVGAWLKENGDAIYGTRVVEPYRAEDFAFTQKDGKVFAMQLFDSDDAPVARSVRIPYTGTVSRVSLLCAGQELAFEKNSEGILVTLPEDLAFEKTPFALTFVLE